MPGEGGVQTSSALENKNMWSNYYGLPSWMRVPMTRLNNTTDFEEYACSPPETDSGFIPDFDTKLTIDPPLKTSRSAPMLADRPFRLAGETQTLDTKDGALKSVKITKPGDLPQQLKIPSAKHLNAQGSISATPSAENTPTSTPQGSPYIIRKNRTEETPCGANPKKWFYTGMFVGENKAADPGPSSLPIPLTEKINPVCPISSYQEEKGNKKERSRKVSLPSPGYKKYTVSNFDLNAVSPTSW